MTGILRGYDSVNPLTAEEKKAVYYVICSVQMIFAAYCEQQKELRELAKTNREMMQYIVDKENLVKSIL